VEVGAIATKKPRFIRRKPVEAAAVVGLSSAAHQGLRCTLSSVGRLILGRKQDYVHRLGKGSPVN